MKDVIAVIIQEFGEDILLNEKKFLNIFKDYAPKMTRETIMLSTALNLGLAKFFVGCPVSERKTNIMKARNTMQGMLTDDITATMIRTFVAALGWAKSPLKQPETQKTTTMPKPKTEIQTEHHHSGNVENHYDKDGYDANGYNRWGFDRSGFGRDGFNKAGYDREGFDREGYSRRGYDKYGYGRDGYNRSGFDRMGFDREGFDSQGWNAAGYGKDGFDRQGFDRDGFDKNGIHRETKTRYDKNGFDKNGYNKLGIKDYMRNL